MDEVLDLTVLRSGLVDGGCVVLFEVGVVFLSEISAPLRLPTSEGHEQFSSCEEGFD